MENVITLGKLIGLLFCSLPPLYFVFENSKNTRNELAHPVMGTIFLVYIYSCSMMAAKENSPLVVFSAMVQDAWSLYLVYLWVDQVRCTVKEENHAGLMLCVLTLITPPIHFVLILIVRLIHCYDVLFFLLFF